MIIDNGRKPTKHYVNDINYFYLKPFSVSDNDEIMIVSLGILRWLNNV